LTPNPISTPAVKNTALLHALLLLSASCLVAGDLPTFATDADADKWLRESSPYYRMMATTIDSRGGYSFRGSEQLSGGMVLWEDGKLLVELGNSLTGAKRVSILIFELTNAYQSPQHQEIDRGVTEGRITTAREFGILHELIEYDGLRHHRVVLQELDRHLQGIPADMVRWLVPKATKLSDYELPFAHDYIKAQEASGHTAHYYEWFPRQLPPPANPAPK
jgi:hypothetical protein